MDVLSDYVLWGSAGHAKVLASLLALRGARVVALVDSAHTAQSVLPGVPLYRGEDGLAAFLASRGEVAGAIGGLVAIGGARGADRRTIHLALRKHGVVVPNVIHPTASVCATARVGSGTHVLALSMLAADVVVGEQCIINNRAAADHECVLADGVHLAPGATLGGCVTVEENVLVGIGAVVLPRIRIGANTIVGAGSVVTRDLPAGVIAVGNPARVVRELSP